MTSSRNPVNWFEIPVADLERAITFYTAVFGYELKRVEMGEMQMAWFPLGDMETPGATGSLVRHECFVPSRAGTLVYFTVPDINAALEKIKVNGGKELKPKTGIGQYGFIAHFEDSEGNGVALHSFA